MVMPMTCSNGSMFPPSPYSYKEFADDCNRQFGVWPREHWITTEFGGMRINLVLKRFGSNIIFSNGMQDPWSRGGFVSLG
nr:lysosomal Pro-X carboxypeptidase-like [Coffea arabica]